MRVLGALERQLPADAVISTGDIVRDGRRGRHWEDWVERVASLRAHAPLFVAPGNHERTYQPGAREAWDRAVGEAPAPRQLWFALDVTEARARFLFLDSNVLTDSRGNYDDAEEDSLSEAQLAWADSMLASSQRYKFVVLHHPLITAGHYLNDWGGDRDTKAAHRRERLFELCARHGVTAVLAGHEHLYQRAWIKTPRGGFWHITTAGGGAPLYSIDRGTRDRVLARALPAGFSLDHASLVARREYHFCRMQIPRASSSGGEFRFDVLAVARNGRVEVIDMIHLNRSPGH
jgi:3',5'-cyclic AMP phosphodiesterase CpdA